MLNKLVIVRADISIDITRRCSLLGSNGEGKTRET